MIHQLQKQLQLYRQHHKVQVNIVGFGSNCCEFIFNPKGFSFEELLRRLESCKSANTIFSSQSNGHDRYGGAPTLEQLDAIQDLSIPILLDCSGQANTQELYLSCIERGIHVSLLAL